MKKLTHVKNVLKGVLKGKRERLLFFISFLFLLIIYSFVLPATYTGGRVGLVSLRLLNLRLFFFAFSFSLVLSLIFVIQVYSASKIRPFVKKKGFFGAISSFFLPLLCCSPFIPTLFAFLSGFLPFLFPFGGFLQGLIGAYETQILLVILLFLLYQFYEATGKMVNEE